MEVILLENIIKLGNIGDKVNVKPGYGRNYLLKTGKALRYNQENLAFVNKKKDELNKKNIELKNKFKETAKLINKKSFTFFKESKENGELYGSIKPKEISNKILEDIKIDIKPSQIVVKENLNKIGSYKVEINFHSEVSAQTQSQWASPPEVLPAVRPPLQRRCLHQALAASLPLWPPGEYPLRQPRKLLQDGLWGGGLLHLH